MTDHERWKELALKDHNTYDAQTLKSTLPKNEFDELKALERKFEQAYAEDSARMEARYHETGNTADLYFDTTTAYLSEWNIGKNVNRPNDFSNNGRTSGW